MTIGDLLPRLDGVRRSSRGFVARCPSHNDRHPSLSISEGDRGILLKCWSGCELEEISAALGLRVKDFFFATESDPRARREAQEQREQQRRKQANVGEVMGFTIDALREAEYFIRSRHGIDIAAWSHEYLHDELTVLGVAYALLEREELYG